MGGGQIWHKLVVPYLLYQLIYLPLCLIHFRNQLFSLNLWYKILIGLIAGDAYYTPISIVICLPCWFIISIIQLRLLFMIIPINKFTSIVLSILSVSLLVMLKKLNIDLYFCLDSTIMAIPYFLVGYYLGRTNLLERVHNKGLQIAIMIVASIAVYGILMINGASQMNGPTYGNSLILNYMAGFSGCLMIFMMSMVIAYYLQAKGGVKKISRYTLFLIFSHWLLLYPICLVLKMLYTSLVAVNPIEVLIIAIFTTIAILWVSSKMIDYGSDRIPALFGKQKNKK